jgi:hypothetical protein
VGTKARQSVPDTFLPNGLIGSGMIEATSAGAVLFRDAGEDREYLLL